jgi:hypothetical protein
MKKILSILLVIFTVDSQFFSYALELKGSFYQGNLIVGKVKSKTKVYIDGQKIKVTDQGFFVFGIAKDRKNDISIETEQINTNKKIIKKV